MQSRKTTIIVCIVIFTAGIVGGGIEFYRMYKDQRGRLEAGALHCALTFPADEVAQLTGTSADTNTDLYRQIIARQKGVFQAHPSIRFMSLLRLDKTTGHVICLAASGPLGEENNIPNVGTPLDDTPDALAAQELANGAKVTVRLFHRDWLNQYWVSGYARAGGPSLLDNNGLLLDVLRYDVDATYWEKRIAENVAWRILAIWVLLGLPFMAYRLGHRHNRQSDQIQELGEAIEQSQTAVIISDIHSNIKYVNPAFCSQTGYTEEELRTMQWRGMRREELSPDEISQREAQVAAGKSVEAEWEFRRKNGSYYAVSATVTPVRDETGNVNITILVLIDITEQRKRDEILLLEKERAEQADQAKSVFLRAMSAEVRTPINNLVALSGSLSRMSFNAEQRGYVDTISKSMETLVRLTGDILDFSRIASGKVEISTSLVNPRTLIEETLDMVAARAAEKNITLLRVVSPEVPREIIIDGIRLNQVLLNLAGNAIKFTPGGEVEIRLKVIASDNALNETVQHEMHETVRRMTLLFSVRDTGIGISPEHQQKLFLPFWQVDTTSSRRYGGAGLGLAICRHIVHMLGGDMCVESKPGNGSIFYFSAVCKLPSNAAPPSIIAGLERVRVLIISKNESLARELMREISACGAYAFTSKPSAFGTVSPDTWDVAVVDCKDAGALTNQIPPHYGCMLGLIEPTIDAAQRQSLGRTFHTLHAKPVHYDLLLGQIARIAKGKIINGGSHGT